MEAAAEAGRLRKAAGAEGQTTFVLTGLEQAASDVATAEHREQLRAVTGGADTAPPKRSFAEAELIDPAEVARQARLPDLIDQGSEPEWDDEDDSAWKRLRSDA